MKTPIKFLVSITLALTPLSARAGNEVGGGGIAENNIRFAMLNLESFLQLCLTSNMCGLYPEERVMVEKIIKAMPEERKNKDGIIFKSGQENPGFFIVDGKPRIAKTEYRVGATIYINTDYLYPQQILTPSTIPPADRPYDIPFAVSLLTHEYGHHHGEKNHDQLDSLGSKIQTLMRSHSLEVDGGPLARELLATTYDFGESKSAELLVRDSSQILILGEDVKKLVHCPKPSDKVTGYSLWNLHWLKMSKVSTNTYLVPLRTRIQVYCQQMQGHSNFQRELQVDLQMIWRPKEQRYEFNKDAIVLRQIDCSITPNDCH